MAKKYKIKHYYGRIGTYRAKPHPVSIILIILALVGLVFLGAVLYKPFSNFVMNLGKPRDASQADPPIVSSAASSESESPESAPEALPADKLRAVYLPHEKAADPAEFDAFLADAKSAGFNAVMLDIKSADGTLLYNTANELALGWGAVAEKTVDLKAAAEKLGQNDMHLIAGMQTFRDPMAARGGQMDGLSIMYEDSGVIWIDRQNKPWLNPYSAGAKDYLIAIAREAAEAGAEMIVLKDVVFPESSGVYATFGPESSEVGRLEALHAFVYDITAALAQEGARVAVCMPAEIPESFWQVGYGGDPVTILAQNAVISLLDGESPLSATSAVTAVKERLMGAAVALMPMAGPERADELRSSEEYILYDSETKYFE